MRTFAYNTLTAGIPPIAPISASAAQIVESFAISVRGNADQHFLSTPFDVCDPLMGTLLGVKDVVSRSLPKLSHS